MKQRAYSIVGVFCTVEYGAWEVWLREDEGSGTSLDLYQLP